MITIFGEFFKLKTILGNEARLHTTHCKSLMRKTNCEQENLLLSIRNIYSYMTFCGLWAIIQW
jgi:hypothetical protein